MVDYYANGATINPLIPRKFLCFYSRQHIHSQVNLPLRVNGPSIPHTLFVNQEDQQRATKVAQLVKVLVAQMGSAPAPPDP